MVGGAGVRDSWRVPYGSRFWGLIAYALIAGCGRVADEAGRPILDTADNDDADGTADSTQDALVPNDADDIADVVAVVETGTSDASPGCAPVSGSAPFAVEMRGSYALSGDGGIRTVDVRLYFPKGRVAGAPVVLVGGFPFVPGILVSRQTIDATLGATGFVLRDPNCGNQLDARLVGPADGLVAHLKINVSEPSDAVSTREGNAALCRYGPHDAIPVWAPASTFLPTDAIVVRNSEPLDLLSFATVTASTSAGTFALIVEEVQSGLFGLRAKESFPPSASFKVDLSGIRDVMGTAFGTTVAPHVLAATAVVTDRTMTTSPPTGAIATLVGSSSTSAGKLTVGDGGLVGDGYAAVIGLGSEPSSTKLRLRHRLVCKLGEYAPVKVQIVASDGTTTVAKPTCADAPADETLTLVGKSPYTLVVDSRSERRPCYYYGSPTKRDYELDELAFE